MPRSSLSPLVSPWAVIAVVAAACTPAPTEKTGDPDPGDPEDPETGGTGGRAAGGSGGAGGINRGGSGGSSSRGGSGGGRADAGVTAPPDDPDPPDEKEDAAAPDAAPLPPDGPPNLIPWHKPGAGGALPPGAFLAGQDGTTLLYPCRAPVAGGLQCGKTAAGGPCAIGWQGAEVAARDYQVLVGDLYAWELGSADSPDIPDEAVICGNLASGSLVYLCRAHHNGGLHPGKVVDGHCSISYRGKEVKVNGYEVLVAGEPPDPPEPFQPAPAAGAGCAADRPGRASAGPSALAVRPRPARDRAFPDLSQCQDRAAPHP